MGNGFKNIAILHDNTTYAKGLADEANGLLKKEEVNIVFFDALTPGEQDYTTILTKLKSKNPDVVFFTGYYPEAGMMLRQKKEMGWDVPFIGGDATNNPDLVSIAVKVRPPVSCFCPRRFPRIFRPKKPWNFWMHTKKNTVPHRVPSGLCSPGMVSGYRRRHPGNQIHEN